MNQTIEELDIIINARVEKARSNLRGVSKEVKKLSKDVTGEFDKMSKSGQLDGIKKDLKDLSKQKIDLSFDVSSLGLDEIESKMEEIKKAKDELVKMGDIFNDTADKEYLGELVDKLLDVRQAYEQAMTSNANSGDPAPSVPTGGEAVSVSADTSQVKKAIEDTRTELQKLQDEAHRLELDGLDPYQVMDLKDCFVLLRNEITQSIPVLANLKSSLQANLNGEYGNSLLMKFQEIGAKAQEIGSKIASPFVNAKNKIISTFSGVKEGITSKLAPITAVVKDTSTVIGRVFSEAKQKMSNFVDSSKPLSALKKLISKIKEIGKETDKAKSKGSNFGSSIGKSIEKGIGSIKKFALSLLSVRGAFTMISRAASSYMNMDTQLQSSIQNSWNVLGSLLAPALELVASLFSKLTSLVATFVQKLAGIDLVARANAKALDSQTKSTKKLGSANNQLSSIDDISSLSSNNGGGGEEPTQLTVEEIDTTPLDNFLAKAFEILSQIFEPFRLAWEDTGSGIIDSIISAVESLGGLGESVFGSLFEVWTNGTGQEIITNILLQFQQIIDIVGNLGDALKKAWDRNDNGTKTIQNIANIFKDIQKFVLDIGDSLNKWVMSDSFQEALGRVFDFIQNIFDIANDIADWLLKMYEKYVKPVIDEKLLPAINKIVIALSDVWNFLKPLIVNFIIPLIKNTLEPVIKGLCDFIGGIIDIIGGIADFISGVFTGDWKKAWSGIKEIFSGIWSSLSSLVTAPINAILGAVEFLVNKLIGGFNSLIRGINKIKFDVPDWVPAIGGKRWGFNIKESSEIELPRLATGQVAYEEQEVVIGEYAGARNNPEIVSPISMMADTFRRELKNADFGGTRIERLAIDIAGRNFFDDVIDYINEKTSRKGVSVIKEA